MKTEPIVPARISFDGSVPSAPDFGDVYHPHIGAFAQARHVFLQGNGLPARWSGHADFVVMETGFGLGNNFLATWQAWRDDPARCTTLHFVSIERHPPLQADLQRAHAESPAPDLARQLLHAWPPLTPNVHALHFEQGRVRLLLALGDVRTLLPALRLQADAFFLDGFAPARNAAMWQPEVLKALGRAAAPGATLATWSAARALREGLTAAGFEVQAASGIGGKRDITLARYAPRFVPRLARETPPPRRALVLGAGIAGAAVAAALADASLDVTVLDRHPAPAAETSGNPAGLVHGTLHADDGPHARLLRAAALFAARRHGALVPGLLRLDDDLTRMQALAAQQGLPADYVEPLSPAQASARAGVSVQRPTWFYPQGGWLRPAEAVRALLATRGIRFIGGMAVHRLQRQGSAWACLHEDGGVLAEADVVVLAASAGVSELLAPWGAPPWPLRHQRGQVTWWDAAGASPLQVALAGGGYALALPEGRVLCGATHQGTPEPGAATVTDEDHRENLARFERLTGLSAPPPQACSGRAGFRLNTDDRLPIAGAVPLLQGLEAPTRLRAVPRERGLFVLTALGGRGFTLAPLLAELVAAQITGTPWPMELDLAEAVDPARWLVRDARRREAQARSGAAPEKR